MLSTSNQLYGATMIKRREIKVIDSTQYRRVFAALVFDDLSVRRLARAAGENNQPDLRLTAAVNYHLTLLFIGDLEASELRRAFGSLAGAETICPEHLSVRGIGPFPTSLGAVLAARVELSPALDTLHHHILSALAETVPDEEKKRRFRPHVTLARRSRQSRRQLAESPFSAELNVAAIGLYCGYQSPSGYRYQCLCSRALESRHIPD